MNQAIRESIMDIQDDLMDTAPTQGTEALKALMCTALGLANDGNVTSCSECHQWGSCRILPNRRHWLVIIGKDAMDVWATGEERAIASAGYVLSENYDITMLHDRCWRYHGDTEQELLVVRL